MSGNGLVRYEAARAALAEAHRVDEAKEIRDKAVAIQAYARQAQDEEMVRWATEIRLRAERRAGELLKDTVKRGPRPTIPRPGTKNTETLKELGISEDQSSEWQRLADIPESRFEAAVAAASGPRELGRGHILRQARNDHSVTPRKGRAIRRTKALDATALAALEGTCEAVAGLDISEVSADLRAQAVRALTRAIRQLLQLRKRVGGQQWQNKTAN